MQIIYSIKRAYNLRVSNHRWKAGQQSDQNVVNKTIKEGEEDVNLNKDTVSS